MSIEFSKKAARYLKKTKLRNPSQHKKITKTLKLLTISANHPSLRLHKLTNSQEQSWSISINRSLRIIFVFQPNGRILVTDIGTHDEVYRE